MYKIQTLNKISPIGLAVFDREKYEVASDINNPDAILLRSFDLHTHAIPATVKAIARAGAGVNNIPIESCTEKGIVVFNTPGANANGVKELAIASLFLASRDICAGVAWAKTLMEKGAAVPELVEKGKSQFEGPEIRGKTLGVIGLGAIGVQVANAASALEMEVYGFDPYLSIDAAWGLSRSVKKARSLENLFAMADYITVHVPLNDKTKNMIDASVFPLMKKGVKIINLSRGAIVPTKDVCEAIKKGIVGKYVTDFPDAELLSTDGVICVPHLGASTPESEDNCAKMAVEQLTDFIETGAVRNSVNFPDSRLDLSGYQRILVVNKNVPNMVGQITTTLAREMVNIADMINHHRDGIAYNIIDVETPVTNKLLDSLRGIEGIIRVDISGNTETSVNE
jgi:D-3-phosphoglycerate dehydrogenase / 2-oxoglutarate reductase